jgi:tight adherence protein B
VWLVNILSWMNHPAALVLAVFVFVALLLLLEGTYLLWRSVFGLQARDLARRLKALELNADRLPLLQSTTDAGPLSAWLDQGLMRRLLRDPLLQADLRWRPWQWLGGSLLAGLGTALALQSLRWPASVTFFLAVGVGLLPTAYVLRRRQQRLARLYAQLPDALDMMARALRAGHAFSSALQMAAQELGEPLAGELRLVHEEVRFGLSLQQALGHLVERAPLTDLRYFVVAVLIQRESGGNLAEVMGKLAQLIRARQRLLSRVRVLSSEGRLSAWILVVLPFALAGLLAVFNPQFISPLWTDPIGIGLLKGMLVMMAIGVFLMVRIVRIRV